MQEELDAMENVKVFEITVDEFIVKLKDTNKFKVKTEELLSKDKLMTVEYACKQEQLSHVYISIKTSFKNMDEDKEKVHDDLAPIFSALGEDYPKELVESSLEDTTFQILEIAPLEHLKVAITNNNEKDNNIQLIITPK